MLRRGSRQQDAGYYTEEGNLCISYKECLQRVFRRRKYHGCRENTVYPPGVIGYEEHRDETQMMNKHSQTDMMNEHSQTDRVYEGILTNRRRVRSSISGRFSLTAISILTMLFLVMVHGLCHQYQKLGMLEEELKSIEGEIDRYRPVTDSVPNFGEESQGARVLSYLSSPSYVVSKPTGLKDWFSYWWWEKEKLQRRVIQGRSVLLTGDCWCFAGRQGHIVVKLSHPVAITQVTLAHISKSQAPKGFIASAPRKFSVYGMRTPSDEGTYLGTRRYDDDGKPIQRFTVWNPNRAVFRFLKLQVEENYGHTVYTCMYNLKVQGNLPI